jgi:predicted DNA-binding protein (UPF0278 family)
MSAIDNSFYCYLIIIGAKMDEVLQQIMKTIEREFKDALNNGLLDSASVANKIWDILIDKEAIKVSVPEPAYGCWENFDE